MKKNKLIDEKIAKSKRFMKKFTKQLWNEIAFFVIWAFSMFVLLIAIIGDDSEKINMFNTLLDVAATVLQLYTIASIIFIFLWFTLFVVILLNWFDNKYGIFKR